MTDYEFLDELGLCHKCRKEKTAPGRKFCFDCLELIRQSNRIRYSPEKAKEYQERRREIYQEKKAAGICVRCTKRATHGMYCYEHYLKEHKKSMERAENAKAERHERGLIPEKRRENGLCLWCGEKTADGTNACENHRRIFSDAGRSKKDKAVSGFWKLIKEKNLNVT